MKQLGEFFNVTVDYLLGAEQKEKAPTLTEKDERDIARRLDAIMDEMTQGSDWMFDGDPMSEEAIESIMPVMKLGLEWSNLC